MTPAALLVCMTIVTNVDHGSVVTNACHYEQPVVAMVTESPFISAAVETTQTLDTEVKALAVVDVPVEVRPAKPSFKKPVAHTARVNHRVKGVKVLPVMTASQFRQSWFKRLAAN